MLYNKIIIIGILLVCVPSTLAWDDEGGIGEDELFDIMFNQAYMHIDTDNPKWYDPIAAIDALLVSFTGYFTHTPPNLQVQVQIKKMVWDGSIYVDDTDFVDLDSSTYMDFKPNTTETFPVPVYKYMKKVLNDNPDEYQGFKTVDEDINHPDMLNVSVTINEGGETLDFDSYGYVTFTNAALNELESQNKLTDYGFVTSGRGSDAGSGGIYTGLNVYNGESDGTAEGAGDLFKQFFYICIPILFIICSFKFILKVMSK
jgi:hypothetical protein